MYRLRVGRQALERLIQKKCSATREIIARRIIAMALLGECNRVRLREDALLYLALRNGSDNPAQDANG